MSALTVLEKHSKNFYFLLRISYFLRRILNPGALENFTWATKQRPTAQVPNYIVRD